MPEISQCSNPNGALVKEGVEFLHDQRITKCPEVKGPTRITESPKGTAPTGIKHNLGVPGSKQLRSCQTAETLFSKSPTGKCNPHKHFLRLRSKDLLFSQSSGKAEQSSAEQGVQIPFGVRRVGILSRLLWDPGRTHFPCF